jgi:glucokinase
VIEPVVADIRGSHARFAVGNVEDARVTGFSDPVSFATVEHASQPVAWATFGQQLGRPLPRAAAIAVAWPIAGKMLKLTNNPWIARPAMIGERLGEEPGLYGAAFAQEQRR